MVASGARDVAEVYVVADSPDPVPPCGGCRQKLAEFAASDVMVTLATVAGETRTTRVGDLLHGAFDAGHMAQV